MFFKGGTCRFATFGNREGQWSTRVGSTMVGNQINNLPWLDGFVCADAKDPNIIPEVGRKLFMKR